uniref:Uncharacterized protein n=1 Tax=Moniliophthora roreri TaxID=221103 RepID=A0A0W0FTK3_MONRR
MSSVVHCFDFKALLQCRVALEKVCHAQGIPLNNIPPAQIFEQWSNLPSAAPKESASEWLKHHEHYAEEFSTEQRSTSLQTDAQVLEVGIDVYDICCYWPKVQALYFGVKCKQPHFVPVPIYPQVCDLPVSTIDHVAIVDSQNALRFKFTAVIQPNSYLTAEDLNILAVKT